MPGRVCTIGAEGYGRYRCERLSGRLHAAGGYAPNDLERDPCRGSRGGVSLVCLPETEATAGTTDMIVEQRLREKLTGALAPVHLEVVNESGQHNVPAGSETHFKVVVVSGAFAGKPRVAQHRMVFRAVDDELRGGVHALAVHTYSEEAWARTAAAAPDSPECLGGKARESA